jgi:UDP-N-acetylglucosamine 2-epimerase
MKILSIVGARPEFIQADPVSRELRREHQEVLVHTGQHYDYAMSQVFFRDLALPEPDYNLGVGSGSHGRQTGEMLARLETVMVNEQPDWVIVRGDTNSTLAGALAAAKLGIPLAHIEAGARSFNRGMPEEINRLVADRVAALLFCIAPSAVGNLAAEGITAGVHYVGDVMYDALLRHLPIARRTSPVLAQLGLRPKRYLLATVHRAVNTDCPGNLRNIVAAFNAIPETIVFPVHPRTRKALDRLGLTFCPHVRAIEPVGYLDMLLLEAEARLILTDSGGVAREAYFAGVPCVTLREETEHVETVACGWNRLAGAEPARILDAVQTFHPEGPQPPIFGDGTAAQRIVSILATA